jgi:hypothetical protein
VGRSLQGAGAVSAAVTALLADQTRDGVRTKAMALVGGSIGLMFAVALVAAPLLAAQIGLAGLFGLTCALALAGIAVVLWWVPPEPPASHARRAAACPMCCAPRSAAPELWRVCAAHRAAGHVGGRARHAGAGRPDQSHHWQVYLPAVVLSFVVMGGCSRWSAAATCARVFLGAIALVLLVQVGLAAVGGAVPWYRWGAGALLFVFSADSTRWRPASPAWLRAWRRPMRGARRWAVYNTLQSLGLFAGGRTGGC